MTGRRPAAPRTALVKILWPTGHEPTTPLVAIVAALATLLILDLLSRRAPAKEEWPTARAVIEQPSAAAKVPTAPIRTVRRLRAAPWNEAFSD